MLKGLLTLQKSLGTLPAMIPFLCPIESHVCDSGRDHEESVSEDHSAAFVTLTFHSEVKGICELLVMCRTRCSLGTSELNVFVFFFMVACYRTLMSRTLLVLSIPRLLLPYFPHCDSVTEKGRHCPVKAIGFGKWQPKYIPNVCTETCKVSLILIPQSIFSPFSPFRAKTSIYKPGKGPEGGERHSDRKCHPQLWGSRGCNRSEMVQGWKTTRFL